MRRFSWPSPWSTGGFVTRREPADRPNTRFRPRLEKCERREVLSTLTVTSAADDGSVGTLRAEIAAAQPGDTINFAQGLQHQTITLDGDQLEIGANLTIQGPGAGLLAILGSPGGDFFHGSRVFQVDAGANVTISGLTIGGGNANAYYSYNSGYSGYHYDGCGGGILNLGTLTVSGCAVTGNKTDPYWGTNTGDLGWKGGGICNFGTMTLSGSTVTSNSAYNSGGGIYNNGTMTLSGSTVSYNSAPAGGGGIYNDTQGALTILSSVVKNNTSYYGADVYSLGSLTISKDSKVVHVSHK